MATPTHVQEIGNQLSIIMDDGTKMIAYPTTGGLWLVRYSSSGGTDFVWPFDPDDITSEWGYRPPPLPGLSDLHSGCDWSKSAGTPIKCAGPGTVYSVIPKGTAGAPGGASWGNRVTISHGFVDGVALFTSYAHMQDSGFPAVTAGQVVSAGQVLGYVGTTGSSTGNHLHFVTFIGGLSIGTVADPENCTDPRVFMATYNPSGSIAA